MVSAGPYVEAASSTIDHHTESSSTRKQKFCRNKRNLLVMSSKKCAIVFLYSVLILNIIGFTVGDDEIIQRFSVPVGQIITIPEDANNVILATPIWLSDDNISEAANVKSYSGIAQLANLGEHVIVTEQDNVQVIEVFEEVKAECGDGVKTVWVEILQNNNLNEMSVAEQINSVNDIYEIIRTNIKDADNNRDDFRVFPLGYLSRYRTISDLITDDFNLTSVDDDRMVISLNVSCGELNDYASDVINAILENSANFRVVVGDLKMSRSPVQTTTMVPIHSFRTTRKIHDNKPVAFNRLSTFVCKRGILCRIDIGENTFMDAEDGSTSKLRLTVHSIDNNKNFLVVVPYSTQIEGIGLDVGTFKFRIEARDHANQTISLPFQVDVEDSLKPNHEFLMTLDTSIDKFNNDAKTLRNFVYRLSAALRGQKEITPLAAAMNAASSVRVSKVIENGPTQVIVRWANVSLSRRVCQERFINETRDLMLAGKNLDRIRHDFRRHMGAQFHVKKVVLEFMASCLLTRSRLIEGLRIRATTTETSVNAEPTSNFVNALMIPLILLAVFLLFITLLTIFYCLHNKHRQQKKKQQQGEFISKGLPVVFPEEVPHDDDVVVSVTTPMLVDREQPPFDPAMTLHENPLYKPPSTQAQLKPIVNPTSTFSTPPSTTRPPLLSSGSKIGAVGQRLPPPYMAAI